MKTIILIRKSDITGLAYGDLCRVLDKNNGIVQEFMCSTWPNEYHPKSKVPGESAYAILATEIDISAVVVGHAKYGKCVYIPEPLDTLWPNPNTNSRMHGKSQADEIFIHCGYSKEWRGSAGCPTIMPDQWPEFISLFEYQEHVKVDIIDEREIRKILA